MYKNDCFVVGCSRLLVVHSHNMAAEQMTFESLGDEKSSLECAACDAVRFQESF